MAREGIESDFCVIGSGLAGLHFALKVADYGSVSVITKKERSDANTNFAQAGIAAVFGVDDSSEYHIQDTLKTGDGLCKEDVVKIMVEEGPGLVKELMELGVNFTTKEEKKLELWREGGHSRRRVVHAGDFTGNKIEKALLNNIKNHPNIKLFEHHIALQIILDDNGEAIGVYVMDTDTEKIEPFLAQSVLLATGGGGQVYLHTTNPSIATGDGIVMAYEAGATVENLEFVQFHPTSLFSREKRERNFLISEAVRGEGAVLRTLAGERFMEKYHPMKDLASRDVVARAIDKELKESGDEYVFLDLSAIPPNKVIEKFPNIYEECKKEGIDITKDKIPVVPAAHYLCGGIKTDTFGKTSIKRLYAAGECASTGVHGANRLASNSLLEALVFSDRAARDAVSLGKKERPFSYKKFRKIVEEPLSEDVRLVSLKEEIKRVMWNYVGIIRTNDRLTWALKKFNLILEEIDELWKEKTISQKIVELKNLARLAYLITKSASLRKESRGAHYNEDYPEKDDKHFKKSTILKIDD